MSTLRKSERSTLVKSAKTASFQAFHTSNVLGLSVKIISEWNLLELSNGKEKIIKAIDRIQPNKTGFKRGSVISLK